MDAIMARNGGLSCSRACSTSRGQGGRCGGRQRRSRAPICDSSHGEREDDVVRLLVGLDLVGEASLAGGARRRLRPGFVFMEENERGGEWRKRVSWGSKGWRGVVLIFSSAARREGATALTTGGARQRANTAAWARQRAGGTTAVPGAELR